MPCGSGTVSLPFGPCTSTRPFCSAIFTPAGTGIGLRPIRDICSSLAPKARIALQFARLWRSMLRPYKFNSLPNFAENFAANFGFAGAAAAHQTLWRRQNIDAQAANDRANVGYTQITARAGARNALHAGDHAAAVRCVLQEYTQHFARLIFVHHLEG